jgi:hypothetical protein
MHITAYDVFLEGQHASVHQPKAMQQSCVRGCRCWDESAVPGIALLCQLCAVLFWSGVQAFWIGQSARHHVNAVDAALVA